MTILPEGMGESLPLNDERLVDIRAALRRSGLPPAWHNTVVDLLDALQSRRAAQPAHRGRVERLEEALEDAVAFINGDISGPSQRAGIIRAARAALSNTAGES